jgi:ATP-binding cassette subfamily F protein 3
MSLLTFHEVSLQFTGQTVLVKVSFHIEPGMKAGLVGENGSGKSTILRLAVGELRPERGSIQRAAASSIAYVPQHSAPAGAGCALDALCAARPGLCQLRPALAALEHATDGAGQQAYAEAAQQYAALGGYSFEQEAQRALAALGLSVEAVRRPLASPSGGERARVSLAAALAGDADLLLLDEPDRHLDIAGREWLARELRRFRGAVVLVSHDRALLDAVVDSVLEVEDGRVCFEHGTLSGYLERKRARLERQAREYEQQQRRIEQLEADIRRTSALAHSFDSRSANDHWRRIGKKIAKTAVVRKRMLERELSEERRVERPRERQRIQLGLGGTHGARQLLSLEDVRLELGGRKLLDWVSLQLERGARIAITGRNGCGKTTLLRVALGLARPDGGMVWRSAAPCFYCDQEHAGLAAQLSALEQLETACGMSRNAAHQLLAKLMLRGRAAHKLAGALSGGERTRLVLAMLMHCPAGLLVLDEPTNHLDLPSMEVLEHALCAYTGGVLLVSHDRRLVANTATQVYELLGGKLIACDV